MTTPDASAALHAHGYRATPARLLVYEAVTTLRHASPEQILAQVHARAPGVNLSTVYRVLDVLESVGLVTHAHIGTGAPTYHSAHHPAHLHFRCYGCGRVDSLPAATADDFIRTVRDQLGFAADMTHAGIDGQCVTCLASGGNDEETS